MEVVKYLIFKDYIMPIIFIAVFIIGIVIWFLILSLKYKIEEICDKRNKIK